MDLQKRVDQVENFRRKEVQTKIGVPRILDLIGNTPMIELDIMAGLKTFAKLDYLNPGGSVKDRSALFIINDAEKRGFLKKGGTIVEASSGNQGIALAMIGAVRGYKVIITIPDRTSEEKIRALKAYGANVVVCPDTDDINSPGSYHSKAEEILENTSNSFMPNQYHNPLNAQAHYSTTGPEIWNQTEGKLTHFLCGAGTCGTINGVGRYLKEKNKKIKIIGIDAATSKFSSKKPKAYKTEGIGIDSAGEIDLSVIDEIIPVEDSSAFSMTKIAAKQFGLLVGLSSGAVLYAFEHQCRSKLASDNFVVMMFADSGRAYLTKVF